MNRLVFEDDDVIQKALMMDSLSDDDCNLINTRRLSSKENTNGFTMQLRGNRKISKRNIKENSANKEMKERKETKKTEEKHDSEDKDQCQNCSQIFDKKELLSHDCGKKKRKSLVLSFYRRQSITSTLNVKNIHKIEIKNDITKSDKRLSIDSNTSQKIGKDNRSKSSRRYKNTNDHDEEEQNLTIIRQSIDLNTNEKVDKEIRRKSSEHDGKNTNDLDEKEQNLEIKTSKTPIFYECPLCFKHFTKKEIDIHNCRDNSPCLKLRFSTSSSFNDGVNKNDLKLPMAKKSVSFKDLPLYDEKDFSYNQKSQIKHPTTELKQPIKSQPIENDNMLAKVNPPTLFEKDNQNDTERKTTLKRRSSDSEKLDKLKTIKRKIDKQTNEIKQPKDTTLKSGVGEVNTIETFSQKLTTTKNTDKPNVRKVTSKNENSNQSDTMDPKSTTSIKTNANFGNEQHPDEVETILNKKGTYVIQEYKSVEKSSTEKREAEIVAKRNERVGGFENKNSNNQKETKQVASKSQSEERKQDKKTDKLLKQRAVSLQSTDKMSIKKNKKPLKTANKVVFSKKSKLFRLKEVKVSLEKEKESTACENVENKKTKAAPSQRKQDGSIRKTNSNSKEEATDNISKGDKKTSNNAIAETLLNNPKVLLEKERVVTSNEKLKNKESVVFTTRNEQIRSTDIQNSNNQREKNSNRNFENEKAKLTLNKKDNGTEQDKSINIQSHEHVNKIGGGIAKKYKRPSLQKKYKCRLCHEKYIKIKHYNHVCKNRVKKTKFEKNKRKNLKKPDMILKNCKYKSQSKINITILARENVKIVTVSNNAKDYEVTQGKISNYVNSDEISKQNEIKETTKQILTTNKSSTETVSQTEFSDISKDKTFEKEKMILDVTEKPETIILQQNAEHNLNKKYNVQELNACEKNSKLQENIATPLKEPQKQNNNEKDIEKQQINNSIDVENTILSQNSDHSYSILDVDNNKSIHAVNSEHAVSTQNVEHNYSATEESIFNVFLCKIDYINTKTAENDSIITENERTMNRTEFAEFKNEENAKDVVTVMGDVESEVTFPENVGSEVIVSENVGSEIIESASEITLPENVRNEISSPESVKSKTISESEITLPENKDFIVLESENCLRTQNIEIENTTHHIGGIANEVNITQNKRLYNNNLTLEDNIVSIDNVAQEIIISASEEEITHEESEIVSIDNHVAVAKYIEDDSFVSIENVEQEVIITTENIEANDGSIENGSEIVISTKPDENVVVIQNVANTVEHTERSKSIKNVKRTNQIEDDNTTSAQTKENTKWTCTNSSGLLNNEQHYINRESFCKIWAETIERHSRNEEIENVSVESLENEVFVPTYVGEKDSIKDLQIEANNSTKIIEASDSIEDVRTNDTYISKQDEITASKQSKTNISTKKVKHDSVKDLQNKTKYVGPSDSINITNISTQNDNKSVENIKNNIEEVKESNQDPTVNIDNSNSILVQNEQTIPGQKEQGILSRQSERSDKIPTNDEIETIIIISSEDENKKNIVLTQNEKNETVIIIAKQKEELAADCNTSPSRIKEITVKDHEIENIIGNQYTKPEDIKIQNERKCLKCSKIFTKYEFKTHNCTEEARDKIKTGRVSKFKLKNVKKLPKKGLNNRKRKNVTENVETKEKEENTLSIETQLAAILNQNVSENKILETQEHSGAHKSDKNNKEKEDTLESQLAAILNQNESQNKMAVQQEHSRMSFANYSKNDEKGENIESPITDNQLLDILSKNVEDTSQKENITKSKCFRCSRNYTVKELTSHNCLQYEEKLTSITKTISIRCFNCSEVYDKTHKCTNTEEQTENNISLEKSDINNQDTTYKKKNEYYFNTYVLKTEHGMYQCKICSKEYTARKNLVRHIHKHEKDYDTERFKCSLCPKKFQYKASMKSHEASHTGETYSCSICDQSFSRKNNLYTHITTLHRDENDSSNQNRKENTRKKHPNLKKNIYACELCDKKYKLKNNLKDHFLNIHAEIKLYKCKYCNRKFGYRSTYLNHTVNCTEAKQNENIKNQENLNTSRLSCKICSKTLKNKTQLKQHEWRHENKHFYCNICGTKFNSKHYLQLHLTNHYELGIQRKKFDCPQCDKQFSTKFGLNLHLNKHNDVKLPCPICEKQFSTKLLLKTHERTHTGQKPFVCDNCKRAFNNRSNFNKHRNNKVCFFRPIEV